MKRALNQVFKRNHFPLKPSKYDFCMTNNFKK